MARVGGARATLAAPAWALRLGLGEMAHLFLDSQRVSARGALAAGFVFRFPDIESAAADLLGGSSPLVGEDSVRLRTQVRGDGACA
jgi:NAD dependent epimerase/dehydratase family enzyme